MITICSAKYEVPPLFFFMAVLLAAEVPDVELRCLKAGNEVAPWMS